VSAETPADHADADADTGLQWGRAHVSAETCGLAQLSATVLPASMGPRSRERGNFALGAFAEDDSRGSFNGAALT